LSYLNDPRVLFAAERTLLAWNRTAIALITLGFVIERFGLFIKTLKLYDIEGERSYSFFIGMGMIMLAVIVSITATVQHHRFIKTLSDQEIPPRYLIWPSYLVNLTIALLGVFLMFYLAQGFGL
jgi:putative membrane protein